MDASEQIRKFSEYFETRHNFEILEALRTGQKFFVVDFLELSKFDPELADVLLDEPENVIRAAEIAVEQFDVEGSVKGFKVRFKNLPASQLVMIKDIRAEHIGRFLAIIGLVRQKSDVRPKVTIAKFECPSCGNIITVPQLDTTFKEPYKCGCGRKGKFRLLSKELVDAQRIVLEESPEDLEGGEQPKRMGVFLERDLVSPLSEKKTNPGSKILVNGVVNETPIIESRTGTKSTRFELFIESNYVEAREESYGDIIVSPEEEAKIKELSEDKNLFPKMVNSIAPSIYGHDKIKEALILQLMAGVRKKRSDGAVNRGDIHILLIGDPGSGKSQLLKRITNVAPKARYVSGKGASAAGLTASVVKDEFMKGWSLEAGALPLTNRGICMIDELDKMTKEDREAMHEALEQQCMLPGFKLMLSDGNYVEIGKYVDNLMEQNKKKVYKGINCEILPVKTAELLSTDFKSHFPARAARVSRHKAPGQFIKIELTNGRIISVTPEHPCWVVENGRITTIPAEKLTRNMFFPIPSEIKIRSRKYEQKNNDLCKILGYHLSDGCYELNRGKKNGIQFWNNDETLIKDYKKSVEKFFKVKPIITRRKHQFAVRVISKRVLEELGKMSGDLLEKGPVKKIPDEIMQLPNENLRYLLRTLFDGDGTVVFQKRNGCRVSLVSQNREMMEQSSDMLLRFGIQSSIFRDRRGNVWKLDVSGQENLNKFLAEIGFLSRHKKQRLTQYCRINKTYRTIKDVVPNCTDKISELFKRAGISAKKEIGHQIDLGVEKHRLFLQKLVRIAVKKTMHFDGKEWSRIKDELMDIEKLAFGYARWMKIKRISKTRNNKIKWVYDVTIEPHHTFISNGMILHNTVSIAKANIQATLRCETTVLAAANPKFGRFNPYEPIAGQIDLPPALINRFDLIFPIKDLPSPDKDEKMAKFILALHKEGTVGYDIETSLLRKYIAYAKQNFNPVLTESAFEELKEYYLKMRASGSTEGSVATIPISARQLEALVRLAEAAAKLRLSDKVQKRDAKKAVELLHYCLTEVGMDRETGKIDIDRIATGITATQRSKIGIVREIIAELENKIGKTIPVEDIMREAAARNVDEDDVEEVIDKLKRSGDIFEPKRGFVQRIY